MKEVWIVGAARTPVGSFNGVFATVTCTDLGATAIRGAIERSGVSDDDIDEVIMGCVLPANQGQAPARMAMIKAGLPAKVAAMTINKVCGSGLKSVGLGVQAILCGDADVVVAGGMESMTLAPHSLAKTRAGYRMGNFTLEDTMIKDGLWDSHNNCHMGNFADQTAAKYGYTREQLDEFTIASYKKAIQAQKDGIFDWEIVPVKVPQRRGDPLVIDQDEEPGRGKFDKIPKLRPAFNKDGVITAANASSINDGAGAVVLVSAEKGKALGLTPLVKFVAQATASLEPQWFTLAPIDSIKKVLAKADWQADDVDVWEINEAFSVVSLKTNDDLGLDPDKVDLHGGAVAIGHPIGASGTRILLTLLNIMQRNPEMKRGAASLCIGGGEAIAMLFEKVE
ncbi:MAG: acetyl-CoA C-acetyltransferase [Candidatus Lernaella stagnicola]|nr:acetyl-CoA C-acetyltransferase [Candidatus Lernaella stagnicola]